VSPSIACSASRGACAHTEHLHSCQDNYTYIKLAATRGPSVKYGPALPKKGIQYGSIGGLLPWPELLKAKIAVIDVTAYVIRSDVTTVDATIALPSYFWAWKDTTSKRYLATLTCHERLFSFALLLVLARPRFWLYLRYAKRHLGTTRFVLECQGTFGPWMEHR